MDEPPDEERRRIEGFAGSLGLLRATAGEEKMGGILKRDGIAGSFGGRRAAD